MSYYFSTIVENSFNVIVQQTGGGIAEVAAVGPALSTKAVQNEASGGIASEVQGLLKNVIEDL